MYLFHVLWLESILLIWLIKMEYISNKKKEIHMLWSVYFRKMVAYEQRYSSQLFTQKLAVLIKNVWAKYKTINKTKWKGRRTVYLRNKLFTEREKNVPFFTQNVENESTWIYFYYEYYSTWIHSLHKQQKKKYRT